MRASWFTALRTAHATARSKKVGLFCHLSHQNLDVFTPRVISNPPSHLLVAGSEQ